MRQHSVFCTEILFLCLFIEKMATSSDVRDILEMETEGQDFITKDALFNDKAKVCVITFLAKEVMFLVLFTTVVLFHISGTSIFMFSSSSIIIVFLYGCLV